MIYCLSGHTIIRVGSRYLLEIKNNRNMKNTGRIISGVAILALGICWALDLSGLINLSFDGWWTLFIIIPCLVSFFTHKHKSGALIGIGVGVLLLLATRDIIMWDLIWKYILCWVAVVWGLSLIFCHKGTCCCHKQCDRASVDELKFVNQEGRQVRKINVTFGKQEYEFNGQRFEGADVETSFGFIALDLRNADIVDGAVINVSCSFGGMEIRVGKDVCVKTAVESTFAGVESQCDFQPTDGVKTLYLKGTCTFGGIEVK